MKKVFRDPIYNLITFDKEKDLLLLKIIDTYEFQRLRRIRQLGVSWLTYPTAVHTRFSHSLGVAFLAGKIFDKLDLEEEITFNDEDGEHTLLKEELKLLLQATALLHDIGHGPFSHAFESVMNQDHEEWSVKIITDESSNVYQLIVADNNDLNKTVPYEKRKLFPRWISDILNGIFPLYYIKEIISSQLDADRLDYLLRDAYMCGVEYARFDLDWIITNLNVGYIEHENNRKGILIDADKGIYSIESFIISRYHMYEQVYFHKTTRAAEKLVETIFSRLKYLVESGQESLIIPVEDTIMSVINNKLSINKYLKLDDFLLLTYINKWRENSEDEILKHLCNNFINRKLYKLVAEGDTQLLSGEEWRSIHNFFEQRSMDDKYYFVTDNYIDVPYKDDYLFGKKRSEDAGHIWLKDKDNHIIELGAASDIIKALRNNLKIKYRAYCDRSIYPVFKESKILLRGF